MYKNLTWVYATKSIIYRSKKFMELGFTPRKNLANLFYKILYNTPRFFLKKHEFEEEKTDYRVFH